MIPRHLVIAMTVLLIAALGLSVYAWHMRKAVISAPVTGKDTRPLAPPVTGPMERVVLFVAHDEDGTLRPESAQIPMPSGRQQRAEELLRAWSRCISTRTRPTRSVRAQKFAAYFWWTPESP